MRLSPCGTMNPGASARATLRQRCALATVLLLLSAYAAAAETPADLCRRLDSDNQFRALPADLIDKAKTAYGPELGAASKPPIWRCMDGKAMVCFPGGERHCSRADTQVMATPDAEAYCRTHPDVDPIPTPITGRDTIFKWSCKDGHARNEGAVRSTDKRGFVKEYWRALD